MKGFEDLCGGDPRGEGEEDVTAQLMGTRHSDIQQNIEDIDLHLE